MSNSFPSMISNEPPPLDLSSEEEDSEEFRTPGLKLDLSAEPSPLSTPRKSVKGQPPVSDSRQQTPETKHSLTNGHGSSDPETSVSSSAKDSPTAEEFQQPQTEKPYVVPPDSPSNDLNTSPADSPQGSEEFTDCYLQTSDFSSQPVEEISIPPLEPVVDIPDCENTSVLNINNVSLVNSDPNRPNSECALPEQIVDCDDSKDLNSELNFETIEKIEQSTSSVDLAASSNDNKDATTMLPDTSNRTSDLSGINNEDLNSMQEEIKDAMVQFSSTSLKTEVVDQETTQQPREVESSKDFEDGFDDFQDANTDVTPVPTLLSPNSLNKEELEDDDGFSQGDDFGDFEAFQSSSNTSYENAPESSIVAQEVENNEIKTSHIGPAEEEDDDDFGDFSSTSAAWSPSVQQQEVTTESSSQNVLTKEISAEDSEDGFADFQNFQAPSAAAAPLPGPSATRRISYSMTPRSSLDLSTMESKFENLVKTVIPNSIETSSERVELECAAGFRNIDKELNESRNSHWAHVQDFEESKGLVFKWPNSHCQQQLYRSLNIDTTTIVYTERWGAIEVPRFAASMVEAALLQPEVCPSSMKTNESTDFVSKSGVSNTEDTQNSYQSGKRPLSKEAQQILQQIPDLSFMRSKTLVFPQAAASKNSLL